MNLSETQKKLIRNFMELRAQDPDNFMVYNRKPYTIVFKNSNSDAKLKYFNMNEYFTVRKKMKNVYLRLDSLINNFRTEVFLSQTMAYKKIGE